VIVAHAIAQVDGDRRGIHVLFVGPNAWLYAPAGWTVERRLWQRPIGERVCVNLRDVLLAELRRERELETPIGIATLRDGTWAHPASGSVSTAEVLVVDLTEPTTTATVAMPSPNWTAYGMRSGKVVAASPAQTAEGQVVLTASAIDRVVVHAQHAEGFFVCALVGEVRGTDWAPITHLQLPLREFDPSLTGEDDEWDLARSRLIPGDDLDRVTFVELAAGLRALGGDDGARPIDRSIRPDPASPETIVGALDPLRLALVDLVVRRALGLAHFDDDPTLQLGQTYQYRVSAAFPPDATVSRPGFHTVPVGTQVPADFFVGDVRVRLAEPAHVGFVPTGTAGDLIVGRRAIPIGPRQRPYWLLPGLLDVAVVLELAVPRHEIVLQSADQVGLRFEALDAAGGAVGSGAVPRGGEALLSFSGAATRIVLRGAARWFGLREVPNPATPVLLASNTGPVVLAEPPPPPPPQSITVTNAAPSTPGTPSAPQPRSPLGFNVVWRPAPALEANAWPPDAEATQPLDATRFELQHELSGGGFSAVVGRDGLVFGDRASQPRAPFGPGTDLSSRFPEQAEPPVGAVPTFSARDHFLRDPEIDLPAPGTEHRYRIRALDEIGRPSPWMTSAPVVLEKRFPPPPPVGLPSAAGGTRLAGVRARVLVRDAPDLTDAERAVLDSNSSTTAIVLGWAWTAEQRDLDPWAREFRVYTSGAGPGPVTGRVTAVTEIGGGRFDVTLDLDRPVGADVARACFLPAGGEYRILAHGAGAAVHATVETLVPAEDGSFAAPRVGPTVFPAPLRGAQSRPEAWDERVEVVPITAAVTYEMVLHDRLLPSADVPRTRVWVAVSAADAEPYVDDSRPGGGRPGNESPLVAVRCEARYHGRPVLDVAPPIGDVPAVTTARAGGAGVEHDLGLLPFLTGTGLGAGERVVVEYLSDGDLLSALRADGTDVVAVPPPAAPEDATPIPIPVPNPDDRTAIVAALTGEPLDLADRYVVWLAARHPFAEWLAAPLEPAVHRLGDPVRFSFAPGSARYVVRVRRVDAAGHRSAGAATCAVVVRVPVVAPLAPPAFDGARWTATQAGPRVELRTTVPDERTTHLLTWTAAIDPRRAQLATVGSRRDLPGFGVRLRAAAGDTLVPAVEDLVGVVADPLTGARSVTTLVDAGAGPHFVWFAAVDRDGVPSRLSGGYRVPMRTV
jgi:hypothetical protein